jgi:hypothetical protein
MHVRTYLEIYNVLGVKESENCVLAELESPAD